MNPPQRLSALEIAEHQLLTALQMWSVGDYISCITLAGAAEEILGKRMRKLGFEPSFENLKEAIVKLAKHFGDTLSNTDKLVGDLMNRTRNELKHYAGDEALEFDLKSDAEEMLERAISNYTSLTGKFPDQMLKFWSSTQ
ncbi:hypothetical protein [Craterilacuibacter sp. RT1T]|uniref:hypothetical protein n=1 Tax=Craterilacuibacter sp. RT1T TaxID=2942211 RepID=UPI0020C12B31|nr:hypothetical protein [Craterilacuibacter sp. RT1T]MCL6264633.1 hypothetical protein [Craterilacuibacter sp. RT1T]